MSPSAEPRPALGKRLLAGIRAELAAQVPRLALWRPVAFGAGAAVYFGRPDEPPVWTLWACLGLGGAIFAAVRRWAAPAGVAGSLLLAAFALTGFAVAQARTLWVDRPVVPLRLGVVEVEGEVIDIRSPSAERWRLLIVPSRIGPLGPADLPGRLRLVTPPEDRTQPGDHVRVLAILNPPGGPASPGAYDFARDAFFEGIGGVGAALSPVVVSPGRDLRGWDAVEAHLNRWRWALATRLAQDLDDLRGPGRPSTGLVAALATSHEAWLPKAAEDDLRGSGLAHMLAIAGLHMAAVSGFVYLAVRLAVAATPALAVRLPGHKLAALCGLLAVLVYLVLSGAHPPARRAAITASVVFLARLTDRRAVSLHALSIAALGVLALEPECVVQPGFQMSFCATGALVAVAEAWRPVRDRVVSAPLLIRVVQAVRDALSGLVVVATVAGLATGPFAIQHFNRTTLYGTPANLLADFLASAVVIRAIALAAVLEACRANPTALAPVLWVAGWGAQGILAVGHLFAHLPVAQMAVASAPDPALLVSFAGLLLAILWRGRLRWIGVALGLAVLVWPRPPPPLGWLGPDGTNAADVVRGQVVAMRPDRRQFAFESFAQHRGLALAGPGDHFQCSRDMCVGPADSHPRLAAWFTRRRPSAQRLVELCDSDILLLSAPVPVPGECRRPLLLRPETFRRFGAAEVLRQGRGWRLDWTAPHRGDRPWTRPPPLAP